jgi:hypothetical protein
VAGGAERKLGGTVETLLCYVVASGVSGEAEAMPHKLAFEKYAALGKSARATRWAGFYDPVVLLH